MANLSQREKRYLERFLEMETGYVLDFSNRTFHNFFIEAINLDIEEERYYANGSSKANRMRTFWEIESDFKVGSFIEKVAEYWLDQINLGRRDHDDTDERLYEKCLEIAERLKASGPIENLDAIAPNTEDESFEKLSETIRNYIENDEPDRGIDRLHTFMIKYLRTLCEKHEIEYEERTPLHSLFGGYVKYLKNENKIETGMTERILKSAISVMEAFNDVRNNQSFAHDNQLLSHNESLLIFNNIANLLRFIKSIEGEESAIIINEDSDELPF